jgi:hypothetical protein
MDYKIAYVFLGFAGHITNQYNTCLWELVKSGKTEKEALEILKVIISSSPSSGICICVGIHVFIFSLFCENSYIQL